MKRSAFKFFLCMLLLFAFWQTLHYHQALVRFPYALAFRECSEVYTAKLVSEGRNPYALSKAPLATQVYGIGLSLIAQPFILIHGRADAFILRLVNGIFIALSALIVYAWARRQDNRLLSAAAALLCYVAWLGEGIPTSKPEGLGLFLLLLSLYWPLQQKYSDASLAVAAGLGIAAYFTKPYFLLGAIFLIPLLWRSRGFKSALLFSAGLGVTLASCLVAAGAIMPLYNYDTILIAINNQSPLKGWMQVQLADYLALLPGMALLPLLFPLRRALNWKPLEQNAPASEAELCFLITAWLVPLHMSRASGVYLTYMLELITPFLALSALSALRRSGAPLGVAALVMGGCLAAAMHGQVRPEALEKERGSACWREVDSFLDPHKKMLVTGPSSLLALDKGMPIQDTGLTEFSKFLKDSKAPALFFPDLERLCGRYDAYVGTIQKEISLGSYDAVLVSPPYLCYPDLLKKHYCLYETCYHFFMQNASTYYGVAFYVKCR